MTVAGVASVVMFAPCRTGPRPPMFIVAKYLHPAQSRPDVDVTVVWWTVRVGGLTGLVKRFTYSVDVQSPSSGFEEGREGVGVTMMELLGAGAAREDGFDGDADGGVGRATEDGPDSARRSFFASTAAFRGELLRSATGLAKTPAAAHVMRWIKCIFDM